MKMKAVNEAKKAEETSFLERAIRPEHEGEK